MMIEFVVGDVGDAVLDIPVILPLLILHALTRCPGNLAKNICLLNISRRKLTFGLILGNSIISLFHNLFFIYEITRRDKTEFVT